MGLDYRYTQAAIALYGLLVWILVLVQGSQTGQYSLKLLAPEPTEVVYTFCKVVYSILSHYLCCVLHICFFVPEPEVKLGVSESLNIASLVYQYCIISVPEGW